MWYLIALIPDLCTLAYFDMIGIVLLMVSIRGYLKEKQIVLVVLSSIGFITAGKFEFDIFGIVLLVMTIRGYLNDRHIVLLVLSSIGFITSSKFKLFE